MNFLNNLTPKSVGENILPESKKNMIIDYRISEESLQKAFVHGLNVEPNQRLEFATDSISKKDREFLLRLNDSNYFYQGKNHHFIKFVSMDIYQKHFVVYRALDIPSEYLPAPTVENIFCILKDVYAENEKLLIEEIEKSRAREAKEKEDRKIEEQNKQAEFEKFLGLEFEQALKQYNTDKNALSSYILGCYPKDHLRADQIDKYEKLKERFDAKNLEIKVETERIRRENIEKLRVWALEKGSDYLKNLIENKFKWVEVARREHWQSLLPEGFEILKNPDKWKEINTPSQEYLAEYKELKTKFDEISLQTYTYNDQYGGSKDVDVIVVILEAMDDPSIDGVFEKVLGEIEYSYDDLN